VTRREWMLAPLRWAADEFTDELQNRLRMFGILDILFSGSGLHAHPWLRAVVCKDRTTCRRRHASSTAKCEHPPVMLIGVPCSRALDT
jgi:hypothetical protein